MNSEFSTKQPLSNLSRNSGWTFLLWSVLYNVLGVFVRKGECFRLRFRGRIPSEEHPRRSCSSNNAKGGWVLGPTECRHKWVSSKKKACRRFQLVLSPVAVHLPHGRSLSTRDSYCHVWSRVSAVTCFTSMFRICEKWAKVQGEHVYIRVFRRRAMTQDSCHRHNTNQKSKVGFTVTWQGSRPVYSHEWIFTIDYATTWYRDLTGWMMWRFHLRCQMPWV